METPNKFEAPNFIIGKYKIYRSENRYIIMEDQEGTERYARGVLHFNNAAKATKMLSSMSEKELEELMWQRVPYLYTLLYILLFTLGFLTISILLSFSYFALSLPNGLNDLTNQNFEQIQHYCWAASFVFGIILISTKWVKKVVSKLTAN